MAHSHSHDHNAHLIEQYCTIIFCAGLGYVSIMLWRRDMLSNILAPKFFLPVLCGGIAILVLVVLRAIALLGLQAQQSSDHAHEHDHEHCHDHDHEHCHDHEHPHEHAHEHPHEHGQGHAHEHAHAHEHGHDHGWNPWRYVVLMLPIVLYFLNFPNAGLTSSGFSSLNASDVDEAAAGKFVENTGLQIHKNSERDLIQVVAVVRDSPAEKAGIKAQDFITQITRTEDSDGKPLAEPEVLPTKGMTAEDAVKKLRGKPLTKVKMTIERQEQTQVIELTRATDVINLGFKELEGTAYTPSTRQYYEGRIVRLKGQFQRSNSERVFSLVRFKITCCAADAIPLNVMIQLDPLAPGNLAQFKPQQWVEVTGRVRFAKLKSRDEYVTIIDVASTTDIRDTPPDTNPYL